MMNSPVMRTSSPSRNGMILFVSTSTITLKTVVSIPYPIRSCLCMDLKCLLRSIRKEMLNTLSPVLLQACECILEAGDPEFSLPCFHHLTLLTELSAVYKNNLFIDSIIHLLVKLTKLSLRLIPYSTRITTLDLQQSNSTNLILIHDESNETLPLPSGYIALKFVEYNPIQQLIRFGSPITVQSYTTLLKIITAFGASIQNGYNEIVFHCETSYIDSTLLLLILLWYYSIRSGTSWLFF